MQRADPLVSQHFLKQQKKKKSFEAEAPIVDGRDLKEEVKVKGLGLRSTKTTRPDSPMKRMQAKFSKNILFYFIES